MEFPELGTHCNKEDCRLLDFLPIKCDACNLVFCTNHYLYDKHDCVKRYEKDNQVPMCPVCSKPVPVPKGYSIDLAVSNHLDQYCKSENTKIFTFACSFKKCKTKELLPFKCSVCSLNFCLKHRHTTDHKCEGESGAKRHLAAEAAMRRTQQSSTSNNSATANNIQAIQGSLSEDEAFARALQLSMDEEANRNPNHVNPVAATGASNSKDKCSLS